MKILLLSLTLLLALEQRSFAHEMAKSGAEVSLRRDRTYSVDIRVDPESLLERLDESIPRRSSRLFTDDELTRRIDALESQFLQRVHVEFDGERTTPSFDYQHQRGGVEGSTLREGVIHLTGVIPRAAKSFRWSYGLLYSSYALQVQREGDAQKQTFWLEGDELSPDIPLNGLADPTRWEVARQYLVLGFTHIVPRGLDHILFVLGIFLLSTKIKPVLAQVTAFTVAHSITLALTMYGVLSMPSRIVEPLIALSIVYVAVENLTTRKVHVWRVAIVFLFGLLHGLGFAGVLRELGLPRNQFATALVTFNVGVELGQLAIIATAFLLLASWTRKRTWYHQRVVAPLSLLIAATGLYWTVERVLVATT
jgi:hydrogenase/urease accessory protein HupE